MRSERTGDAVVMYSGAGEWYNQRAWAMCEDDHLPSANWHAEVDGVIESQESRYSVLVIDVTELPHLVIGDYGFLLRLFKRLGSAGVSVRVVARPHVRPAFALLEKKLMVVGTIEEALEGQ